MADDINPIIRQYIERPGQPYLSPAYIISANTGPKNLTQSTPLLSLPLLNNDTITVPSPAKGPKSATLPTATLPIGSAQYAVASAPTSGIYTGVEDSC